MFHHFFDDGRHPEGQGALSADKFGALLDCYEGSILGAAEWCAGHLSGDLPDGQICLTFDDGLRSQFDIALPVLEERGLTAFWFPYTSPLAGGEDRLEIYRLFRTVRFADVEEFYKSFDNAWSNSQWNNKIATALAEFDPSQYMKKDTYYTDGDRKFRFIRDQILGANDFCYLMDVLIENDGFDREQAIKDLWITADQLRHLHDTGHILGLHSHTHPTSMTDLNWERQQWEYDTCHNHLSEIMGSDPFCVAYPCGSYDQRSVEFLSGMEIKLGFGTHMEPSTSVMETPRLNHAIALQQMNI